MATDNRTPDDLQEAVAATLRRLRGEVRSQGPATGIERTEPQFSSPLGEHAPPAAARADNLEEPDLLSGAEPEIPPTPAGRSAMGEGAIAYQEQAARGRLRWLPYALSLTAIVVFAGIVWWAYHAILDAPKNGPVPVIAADQTPPKVPPADQGAANGSGQEKTVYDQISGANTQPKTEVLLPAPETPQAPPPPAPAPAASETPPAPAATETTTTLPPVPVAPATTTGGTTDGTTATQQTMSTANTGTANTGSSTGTTTGTMAETTTTQQTATTTADTGSSTAGATTTSDVDLSGVPTLSPATPLLATSVPAATMVDNSGTAGATTQTGAVADNFHIQLAALKSEAEANKAWTRILAKHNDVLSALTVHIVRADLGSQGIYYRVQAGPFADKASAKAACDKLKSGGQQCLIKP
jgi:cell division septation protein DedD